MYRVSTKSCYQTILRNYRVESPFFIDTQRHTAEALDHAGHNSSEGRRRRPGAPSGFVSSWTTASLVSPSSSSGVFLRKNGEKQLSFLLGICGPYRFLVTGSLIFPAVDPLAFPSTCPSTVSSVCVCVFFHLSGQ